MEEIMQSNHFFIVPLTIAYGTICGLWFFLNRGGRLWEIQNIPTPEKPWKDLVLGLIAAIAILAIGQLYSSGYLIPHSGNEKLNLLIWPLNNVIIFSPIFLVLIIRRQGPETVFLSVKHIPLKLTFGIVASVVGVLIFAGLRGEWARLTEIASRSVSLSSLSYFPAVFFENVALAFLFVRLKWVVGIKWAILIPAVLFAVSHVPGSIAEGDPWSHIITFFFLTGGLTTFILYTAYRSRDIFWLGIVHYLMDLAIKTF